MPTNKNTPLPIDKLDMSLLSSLALDAEVSIATMAKKNHVSASQINARIRELKARGIIEGTRTKINLTGLGYQITAFIGIFLKKGDFHHLVIEGLKKIPEVVRAHTLTGHYSILAEVICADTDHFRLILSDYIQAITGVERTESMLSLQEDFTRSVRLSHLAVMK